MARPVIITDEILVECDRRASKGRGDRSGERIADLAVEFGVSYQALRQKLADFRRSGKSTSTRKRSTKTPLAKGGKSIKTPRVVTVKYPEVSPEIMDDDDDEEEFEEEEEEEEEDEDEEPDPVDDGVTWDDLKPADRRVFVQSYFDLPDFQREDGSVILQEVADELGVPLPTIRGYYVQYRRKLKQEGRLQEAPPPEPEEEDEEPEVVPVPRFSGNGNGRGRTDLPAPPNLSPDMWFQLEQQKLEWERTKYHDAQRRREERAWEARRLKAEEQARKENAKMMDRLFNVLDNRNNGGGGLLGSPTLNAVIEDKIADMIVSGGGGEKKSDAVQIFEMINKSGLDKEIVGAIRDYRRDDPKYDPYDDEDEEEEEIKVTPDIYRKGLREFLEPSVKDDKQAKQVLRQQIDITVENVLEEFGEETDPEKLTAIMGSRMNLIRKVRDIGLQLKKVSEEKKTVDALVEEFWEHSPDFAGQLGRLEYHQILSLVEQYQHTGGVAKDYDFLSRTDIREIGESALAKLRTYKQDRDL